MERERKMEIRNGRTGRLEGSTFQWRCNFTMKVKRMVASSTNEEEGGLIVEVKNATTGEER